MSRGHNLPNIRTLLTESFTATELRRLCYDTPNFRPVYDELSPELNKTEIIDRLLEYADRKLLLDTLLLWLQKYYPAPYGQHQPYYILDDIDEESHFTNYGNKSSFLSSHQEIFPITSKPPCPYPGMVPFSAKDVRFFYGRDAEIRQMLQHLRHHNFLIVIGPSGSGKSSSISAGLLPRLQKSSYFPQDSWLIREIRPGSRPLQVLKETVGENLEQPEQALVEILASHPPAQRLLLVIDQFEEIFTQTGTHERQQFITYLQILQKLKICTLLLIMRADFYPDLMNSDLWPIKYHQRLEIAPLRGEMLRQAIQQPAADLGVDLEVGLLTRLLADAADEPGVLPLLQETMVLLWEEMENKLIPLNAYEKLGDKGRSGLAVAIAAKADFVLDELSSTQQLIARRIFMRLIQFGEGRADTRRQQPMSALQSNTDDTDLFDQTLYHLTNNRLLTLSGKEGDTDKKVDISHEALITGWPTLQNWLSERREAEQTRRRLEAKANEWVRLGQGSSGLLDEIQLVEAERWLNEPDANDLGYSEILVKLVETSKTAHKRGHELQKIMSAAINNYFYVIEITEDECYNTFISPQFEALTGYSIENLAIDWRFLPPIVHPDDKDKTAKIKERELAAKQNVELEYRLVRKDGKVIWVSDIAKVQDGGHSKIIHGILNDITKRKQVEVEITQRNTEMQTLRKQAEAELVQREQIEATVIQRNAELLALQFAGATIASSLDLDYVLDAVTREMTHLLGVNSCIISEWSPLAGIVRVIARYNIEGYWQKREVANFPLIKYVLVERRAQQMTISQSSIDPTELAYMRAINIKTLLVLPMEFKNQVIGLVELMNDNVERTFTNEEIALVQLLANQAASAIENARLYTKLHEQARQEIAERSQAEEALRHSEARNRALLNAIPDLIFRVTLNGQYLDYHSGKEWDLTLPATEYIGKNLKDVFPPPIAKLMLDHIHKALDSSSIQVFEYQLTLPQGIQHYETRLVISGPDEVLGIVRNITERKQAEAQAIQAERLIALGQLVTSLHREINNPLQSIQTHLDLVLDFQLSSREKKKYLYLIRQEIERLSNITRYTLNFAQPKQLLHQPVLVTDLLQQVLVLAGKQLQQSGIQVTTDFRPVPTVRVAPDQLTQVFLNLVINTIEAISPSGQLHIAVYPEAHQVVVSFTNNGPIIPPELLPYIFEPFFTTKPDGNGLGLWVSHSLIQQYGGTLVVENLGSSQGVVFTIKLPSVSSDDNIPD